MLDFPTHVAGFTASGEVTKKFMNQCLFLGLKRFF